MDQFAGEKMNRKDTNENESLLPSKSIVVEFVGPTGSGKTANCLCFSGLLRKNGLKVSMFSDLKDYLYSQKFHIKFLIALKTLIFNGTDFIRYFLILANHGIYSFDSIFRYIKLCVFNMALQQFIEKKKVDVLLLDQWIIQGLWSATIFKLKSYDTLHDKLKRFYFKTGVVLYFDIDTATASERVGSRDSYSSRFDRMDSDRRLVEFKKYNAYLFQLYENSNCKNKLQFSTTVSPAKNAEDFLHQLNHMITYE